MSALCASFNTVRVDNWKRDPMLLEKLFDSRLKKRRLWVLLSLSLMIPESWLTLKSSLDNPVKVSTLPRKEPEN
jgi:hypothetical protein